MTTDLKIASGRREEEVFFEDIDKRLDILLANYQRVTANPRSMGYLRFLLRHYAKSSTPWRSCYKDNLRRFGPDKTKGLCGVLKDLIRQNTHWRGKNNPHDVGTPGVAIGYADQKAAPPWGGHKHDLGEMAVPDEIALILEDINSKCDVYRVLIGLDEAPSELGIAL